MDSDSMLQWVSKYCMKGPKVGSIHGQRDKRIKSDKSILMRKLTGGPRCKQQNQIRDRREAGTLPTRSKSQKKMEESIGQKSASPTGTPQTDAASHEKAETIMKVNGRVRRQ
jgi:phage FluMu protein Com